MKQVGKLMLAALVVAQLSGCATLERVKPWERGTLAKKEMALNSAGLDNALDDHIYFSKEGSSGGRSFAGGGCGCN
jgi:uncharacterized lipoprotein